MTILHLIALIGCTALVFGILDLIAEFCERFADKHRHHRELRWRARKWPRYGHTDHFFTDLRRGYFPEDE